jgi:hypothetical protein
MKLYATTKTNLQKQSTKGRRHGQYSNAQQLSNELDRLEVLAKCRGTK